MAVIGDPANIRSRRTRSALLTAARRLIEERGFGALTMGAVAERAGVTRRAAYLHFASRSDLVNALFDYVAATGGLEDSTRPVWEATDAVAALDAWAQHLARYHPRLLAVTRAVESVRRSDPDASQHHQRVMQAQRANCGRLAAWLAREHRLAPPWTIDTATDMLWALISSDMVERLLVERQWTTEHFAEHLSLLLRSTFASDGAPPRGS